MPDLGAADPRGVPPEAACPIQYGARIQATGVYLLEYQLVPQEQTTELLEDLFERAASGLPRGPPRRDWFLRGREAVLAALGSGDGATAFCRIRGHIPTVRKQGQDVLATLEHVLAGSPAVPSQAG